MKKLFTVLLMVLTYVVATAQYTYDVTYLPNAGNPSGLNTNSDSYTSGYTQLTNGGEASNFWSGTYALPFAFDFYGTPVTHFKVSGNGVLTFDTLATALPVDGNTNLPAGATANIPDNSIMWFWDAFSGSAPIGSNDRIWVGEYGTAPNRQVQIDYFSYEYGNTGSTHVSSFTYWGLVLEESTNKIYVIDKNYHNGGGNLTATIGVQKDAATAVQWGDSLTGMGSGSTGAADNDLYEFTPRLLVADNAAVTSIDNPALPTCNLANQSVQATILNDGNNAINSVTVNWAVNGVAQTPLSYTTPLAIGASAQVTLGTYSFNAFDNLEVWTSAPNGNPDGNTANDSLSLSLATGLVGTFTIDSLLPSGGTNFQSFTDAVAAMTNSGFCGAVTFNVAAGTWNESITLPDLGNTSTQTVTFNGAGMGMTTLTYDGSGSSTSTILLDGADWITFKNMTIENTDQTTAFAVRLAGSADHNTIDSCHVISYDNSTSSAVAAIVASASPTSASSTGNNANYTTISNCTIEGGYYSVRFNASFSADNYYNQIINVHAKDFYAYGFYGSYQDSLTIFGCTAEDSRATFGYGIYSFSSHNVDFQSNWIQPQETYGIYCSGCTGTSGRSKIINNMTTVDGTNAEALYVPSAQNMDIFHNSAKSTGEQAFYLTGSGTGVDIRNNIFVSETNTTVDFTSGLSGTGATFGNNLVYRMDGSGNLLENGSTATTDIAGVNALGGAFNTANVEGDPNFVNVSTGDLHVTVGAGLTAGDNSVGVMTDIDGDARPFAPTTIVDLGADEIFVQALDAGVVSFDSPLAPVNAGLQDIKVSIKNNGANPVTTVTIAWSVDGVVQTPFSWTGNLTIGQEANDITIGQYNIASGFSDFEVWTEAPNGGMDGDLSNDTLYYDLCTAFKGNYTVGTGMTDDFPDLQSAADALAFCGVDSVVNIMIAPGTYTTHVEFNDIPGASMMNPITIDGMDKDSVTFAYTAGSGPNGDNAAIRFNGADWVTLQNVTVDVTGTSAAWGVQYTNAADNNTLQDSRIAMDASATSTTVVGVTATSSNTSTFGTGDNADNLAILNNEIIGGGYGIMLYGDGSFGNEAALNQNNRVEGNTIMDVYSYGMRLSFQAGAVIKANDVLGLRQTSNFTGHGIYVSDNMNVTIEENFVEQASAYGIYAVDINFDYTATKASNIINNMATTTSSGGEALFLDDAELTNVYHNTFKSVGEQAGYFNDILNVDIRNNIFVSETNTTVDFLDAMNVSNTVNYNIYHRADGAGNLIEVGSSSYTDLASWQTDPSNSGYDANSQEGDPIFKDASIGDLHVVGGLPNDVGDNSVNILVDIDGDTRPEAPSVTVDIGADEYTPLNDDAKPLEVSINLGGCGAMMDTVFVTVQNLGLNTITVLPITVDITGGGVNTTLSTTAAVNMPFLGTETIAVGSFNSTAGGDYDFTAYTALAGDQSTENDTVMGVGARFYLDGIVTDVACLGDTSGAIDLQLLNAQGLDGSLGTNFNSNNGSGGNMFDIDVLKAGGVVITGFEVNTTGGTAVDLYYKSGTYAGNENTAAAWTFYGSIPIVPAGLDQVTTVTLPTPLVLNQGINALFIASNAGGWRYIGTGTAPITVAASNSDMIIYDGIGKSNNQFTGTNFGPVRTFSGNIIYQGQDPIVSWSTGDTTTSIANLLGGTYTATVTDGVGCTTNSSFTVNQPTNMPPSVTGVGADISCFGAGDGSIMATATGGTGGLTYTWSNGDSTQNLMNVGPGTYSLVVTDANGCADSTGVMNITLSQPDTLIATLANVTTIGCDSVEVSTNVIGGNSGFTYSWSGGGTDSTLLVTGSGTYTATVSDMMGCTDTLSAMVTFPTAVSATAMMMASDTAGTGVGSASVTAVDGTAPYTYLWSDGQTTMMATGLAAGNYTVTVTDANGCETTAMVTVGFPTNLTGIDAFSTLEMFPNPTTGFVTFNISMKASTDLTVSIFDVSGKEVTSFTRNNAMMVTETFDASYLPEGVYMVRFIAGEEGVVTRKLVVGTK